MDAILASYVECKSKKITSIFFNALHVFRQYSNWLGLVSELDCLMAVVGPVLNKIMALQQKIKRTWYCTNLAVLLSTCPISLSEFSIM